MAYDITTAANTLKAALEALTDGNGDALFYEVLVGTGHTQPGEGPSARITFGPMQVAETTLTHPIELHDIIVQVFLQSYSFDEDDRALKASALAAEVASSVYADFTLGGTCRNVDIGGQYSSGVEVDIVDEDVSEAAYHVANITIPIIVDNTTAFVA